MKIINTIKLLLTIRMSHIKVLLGIKPKHVRDNYKRVYARISNTRTLAGADAMWDEVLRFHHINSRFADVDAMYWSLTQRLKEKELELIHMGFRATVSARK